MSKEIIYDKKFYQAYTEFAGDVLSPVIIEQARQYIKGMVLDVGAGSGAMMRELRIHKNIKRVIGMDIAPNSPGIHEASIDNIPFFENYFDTVTCSEVLEHLDDKTLSKGIAEMHRVLKPGGHVIITVPYKYDFPQNRVTCPSCGTSFDRWGHVQSFDESTMEKTLSPYFTIIKNKPISLGFLNAHKNLRWLLPLLRIAGLFKSNENLFVVAKKV